MVQARTAPVAAAAPAIVPPPAPLPLLRVLAVVGTRPEALKLAPLILALDGRSDVSMHVLNSRQHPLAAEHALAEHGLGSHWRLDRRPASSLTRAVRALERGITAAARRIAPHVLVAQGDTATAYATARAARALGIRLAHVEAGLRTPDPREPFPEEWFRRRIGAWADLHFAPTVGAVANLLAEGADPRRIHPVGNTVVDLLRQLSPAGDAAAADVVLVAVHRRENRGGSLAALAAALAEVLDAHPALQLHVCLHPNPQARRPLQRHLGGLPRLHWLPPLSHLEFTRRLGAAAAVVSDSGGIQEEAAYLGTPVVLLRPQTERPEAVAHGCVTLAGDRAEQIAATLRRVLREPRPRPMQFDATAAFGDGHAGLRIAEILTGLDRAPHAPPPSPAEPLARWLLQGPARLRCGADHGAWSGGADAAGCADYAYGEITGYALSWLAPREDPSAHEALAAAVAWIERRVRRDRRCPVRDPVDGSDPGWYRNARFAFDIAMVLRGLAAARSRRHAVDAGVVDCLGAELLQLAHPRNGLQVAHPIDPARPLPERWSTMPGPFQAKTASAVLDAAAVFALPPALVDAARRLLHRACRTPAVPRAGDSAHAWLYHVEGLLQFTARHAPDDLLLHRAAGVVRHLLSRGASLRESIDRGPLRSDVLAQLLRAVAWLRDRDVGVADAACGDRIARHLLAAITADGGLPFALDAPHGPRCTWSALFAEQALRWWHAPGASLVEEIT